MVSPKNELERRGSAVSQVPDHKPVAKLVSLEQLHTLTVAEARRVLKKTWMDVDAKQEELRDLVGVRYRDFIDAADIISGMGGQAKSIIDTSGKLSGSCTNLLSASWKSAPKPPPEKATAARGLLEVIRAPEAIATELEQRHHLDAAKKLITARESCKKLRKSTDPSVVQWLSQPYVRQRVRTVLGDALSSSVVSASEAFMKDAESGGALDTAGFADAVAAMMLVKSTSTHDALDSFLDARSACMKALCSRISAVGDEGEEETVGKRQLDMECASVALVQTVCAAIQLFTGLPPQKDGSVEPEGGEALLVALLKDEEGVEVLPEMLAPVELEHCRECTRAWSKSMAAAVRAATGAALHRVEGGGMLAALERGVKEHCAKAEQGKGDRKSVV